ncbi:MAG TPA: hypothetical protein VIX20_03630, partial [Ktedonobacteraceae bacterium]
IDARNAALRKWANWYRFVIGGNGFVLGACPVKDHRLGQTPGPVEDQRFVTLAIGKTKVAIFELHRRPFVLDPEVPLAPPGRLGIGIACLCALPPTGKAGKERLDTGICGVSVQLLRGEEPHQMFWLQPDTLAPYGAPEKDQRSGIELAALPRQLIELGGLADVYPSHPVHKAGPPRAKFSSGQNGSRRCRSWLHICDGSEQSRLDHRPLN